MIKKLLILTLALTVSLATVAVAQDTASDMGKTQKSADAPLKNIKGTVKAEGDKLTFVADKGNKTWDVANPEALKGHEGHHVEVSAHVYADKNQIHVMNVKMLKGGNDMKPSDNTSK
jgi:hypothetical protein